MFFPGDLVRATASMNLIKDLKHITGGTCSTIVSRVQVDDVLLIIGRLKQDPLVQYIMLHARTGKIGYISSLARASTWLKRVN